MIYEPNKQQWRRGDVVLHDCDAKEPKMLMRVVGYNKENGLCITTYCIKGQYSRKRFENEIKYLHDPLQFGISPRIGDRAKEFIADAQWHWEWVRRWNHNYEVGQHVRVTSVDGPDEAITRSKAVFWKEGRGAIWLSHLDGRPIVGSWHVEFIEAIKAPDFVPVWEKRMNEKHKRLTRVAND